MLMMLARGAHRPDGRKGVWLVAGAGWVGGRVAAWVLVCLGGWLGECLGGRAVGWVDLNQTSLRTQPTKPLISDNNETPKPRALNLHCCTNTLLWCS